MKIGERGQVTIPKELRERFGLKPETEVQFEVVNNSVLLRKKPRKLNLTRWKGKCRKSFAHPGTTRVDEFIEDVRRVAHTLPFMYALREHPQHLPHRVLSMAGPGILTVADIKHDIGATRRRTGHPQAAFRHTRGWLIHFLSRWWRLRRALFAMQAAPRGRLSRVQGVIVTKWFASAASFNFLSFVASGRREARAACR